MVCTNKNQTWNSDCEVHRERCLCDTNDPRCKSADLKHVHVNYYGECKQIQVLFETNNLIKSNQITNSRPGQIIGLTCSF